MLKNAFWMTLANISQTISGILIALLVGRSLGPAFLGDYSFSYAFGVLASILINVGFPTLIVRNVAAHKDLHNKYFVNILFSKLALALVAIIFICIAGFLFKKDNFYLFVSINLAGLLSSFAVFFFMFLRAHEKMKPEGLVNTIVNISGALAFLFLYAAGKMALINIIAVLVIKEVVRVFFAFFVYKRFFNAEFQKHLFKIHDSFEIAYNSLKFATNDFVNMLNLQIDVLMLGFMQTNTAVGYYSAALRFVNPFRMIVFSISQAALPKLSYIWVNQREMFSRYFHKYLRYVIIGMIVISIPIFLNAHYLIEILFGKNFSPSINLLKIFSIFLVFFSALPYLSTSLYSRHKESVVLRISIICMVLNVIGNAVLIAMFSYYGALIATVSVTVFSVIYSYHCCRRAVID